MNANNNAASHEMLRSHNCYHERDVVRFPSLFFTNPDPDTLLAE